MSNFDLKNIKFFYSAVHFYQDLKSECRTCFGFLVGTIGRLFIRFNRPDVASNSIKTLKN